MAKKTVSEPSGVSVEDLTLQLKQMEGQWKRALADYQNLEKRVAQNQQQFVKLATAGLIIKIVPIIDHLKRAAEHLKDQGLNMIVKQFENILAEEDVKPIEALHKPFDPKTMEAVERVEGKENEVMEVTETGYTMGEQVLRPAKVKVGVKTSEVNN